MVHIFVILGTSTSGLFQNGDLHLLAKELVAVVKERFNILNKDKIVFTAIKSEYDLDQADFHIEIRYAMSTDKYLSKDHFTLGEQTDQEENLSEFIEEAFRAFMTRRGFPQYSLGIFFNPFCRGGFIELPGE